MPMATASPPRVMEFTLMPNPLKTSIVMAKDRGIAISVMNVVRRFVVGSVRRGTTASLPSGAWSKWDCGMGRSSGVIGTNFMKNILVEDCVLSRMDVHMGASGAYTIRRSTLGHMGLNAIGRGTLLVEDSTLHGGSFISFRADYGSTWEGEVIVRNSRWQPPAGRGGLILFNGSNDGTHDFGYACFMPQVIRIDGLSVDDVAPNGEPRTLSYFNNLLGAPRADRPFPYRLTERIEVKGLKTASGQTPRVSDSAELAAGASGPTRNGRTSSMIVGSRHAR